MHIVSNIEVVGSFSSCCFLASCARASCAKLSCPLIFFAPIVPVVSVRFYLVISSQQVVEDSGPIVGPIARQDARLSRIQRRAKTSSASRGSASVTVVQTELCFKAYQATIVTISERLSRLITNRPQASDLPSRSSSPNQHASKLC